MLGNLWTWCLILIYNNTYIIICLYSVVFMFNMESSCIFYFLFFSCRWKVWVVGWLWGGSELITDTLYTPTWRPVVSGERGSNTWRRKKNAHWGLIRGGKLFGFGLDPLIDLWFQDSVFLRHGVTQIHTVEINGKHYRLYDFGEKLVQSWTSFFFPRTRILSNSYGLKQKQETLMKQKLKRWTKIIFKKLFPKFRLP